MKSYKDFFIFLVVTLGLILLMGFMIINLYDKNMPILLIILLFVLLMTQATYIFFDSKRRKDRYYWLWGLFGLLNVPSSLIIYLLVTRVILKDKNNT